ncbi:MAG: potassium channel beta subunit family protein [Janthinobacterium lividum]
MQYRRLGRSGLKVSELSIGSWVTYGTQMDAKAAAQTLAAAYDQGVNFFDNAEAYAAGKSEELMGAALRQAGWPRLNYVVSTKFYWGLENRPNQWRTLNRKYLSHAIDASLQRFGLDYIDLVFCHRADPTTPIEETVWAMHQMIEQGKVLYWGTSEWAPDEIRAAWDIAERHHLHKPVMEQPQYNLFHRRRVEKEYARLYEDIGLGLTTWSPLASGLLSGKYRNGIPPDSRGALPGYEFLHKQLTDASKNERVGKLAELAQELGCTLSQLSLAWILKNPQVSTVITGATSIAQIDENMKASEIAAKWGSDVKTRIEAIVGDKFD